MRDDQSRMSGLVCRHPICGHDRDRGGHCRLRHHHDLDGDHCHRDWSGRIDAFVLEQIYLWTNRL